jgi:hypothetical protein
LETLLNDPDFHAIKAMWSTTSSAHEEVINDDLADDPQGL